MDFVHNIINNIRGVLFINPIRNLYFKGPWINGWGFWSGKTMEEICTYMNPSTSQMHWMKNTDDCIELVDKRFDSFMVSIYFGLYCFAIYKILQSIWFRFFMMQPLAREVAMYLEPNIKQKRLKLH